MKGEGHKVNIREASMCDIGIIIYNLS